MNIRACVCAVAIVALCGAGNAVAQVIVNSLNQTQSGSNNTQQTNIGNASGGNRAVVIVGNVTQIQRGTGKRQQLDIGNATSGSAMVQTGDVIQLTNGKIEIGNNGGRAVITGTE
jgi:hypothetical protein